MQNRKFYVYTFLTAESEILYVGKGSRGRWQAHLHRDGFEGEDLLIRLKYFDAEQEALQYEKYLIKKLNPKYNIIHKNTDGSFFIPDEYNLMDPTDKDEIKSFYELLQEPTSAVDEWSFRIQHYLSDNGIVTLQDLVQKTRIDLLKIKNLGKKSVDTIEKKLNEMGLHLGTNVYRIYSAAAS